MVDYINEETEIKKGLHLDDDEVWRYYEKNQFVEFTGVLDFEGWQFFVADGILCSDANGLAEYGDKWYFLAAGQVQSQYTGLALYDGWWFYITDGVLDTRKKGLIPYDGSLFLVADGQILRNVSGLWYDPFDSFEWYYLADGQVVTYYTGLAQYDGATFYVIEGRLASENTGNVEFEGASFHVIGGRVIENATVNRASTLNGVPEPVAEDVYVEPEVVELFVEDTPVEIFFEPFTETVNELTVDKAAAKDTSVGGDLSDDALHQRADESENIDDVPSEEPSISEEADVLEVPATVMIETDAPETIEMEETEIIGSPENDGTEPTEDNAVTLEETDESGGNIEPAENANDKKIREFVNHCYTTVLGREADEAGLNGYTHQITTGVKTPKQIARAFIFSDEFQGKQLNNEDTVQILYRLYMYRQADAEGLNAWVAQLDAGVSLDEVVNGFAESTEFTDIINGLK